MGKLILKETIKVEHDMTSPHANSYSQTKIRNIVAKSEADVVVVKTINGEVYCVSLLNTWFCDGGDNDWRCGLSALDVVTLELFYYQNG